MIEPDEDSGEMKDGDSQGDVEMEDSGGPMDQRGGFQPSPVNDDDEDGLTNGEEQVYGTDKDNPDSDNDGLPDGYEVNVVETNPLLNDTDSDGLDDIV